MVDWQRPDSSPTLPFDDLTYSVSELCAEVRDTLRAAPARWVAGEVQRLRRSRAGHVYLELIEKGEGDRVIGKLEAVLWRRDAQSIEKSLRESGQEIADGLEIRCLGEIDFYAPFGRLQLVVREIDSVFLLGQLSQRRQETMRALTRAGLLDLNRQRKLPRVPLDLALVTSEGSAAYHDFVSTLLESGLGFRVLFIHAAVQGQAAEEEIASALAVAATLEVDCAALIRGGGSKTDLAAFDSRRVAEAVARSEVPVVTGLGHEIDLSIADQVAHSSLKTPTRAAEFLVQQVLSSEQSIDELTHRIQRGCRQQVDESWNSIGRVEAGLRLAGFQVRGEKHRLTRLRDLLSRSGASRLDHARSRLRVEGGRVAVAAPRILGRREGEALSVHRRALVAAQSRLRTAYVGLEGMARLCSQIGPQKTLARGFSITRNARGRVVTAKEQVAAGEVITTEVADGVLSSRVEE